DELSRAVSRLTAQADTVLDDGVEACEQWLHDEVQLPRPAAQQLALYLGASKASLGRLPTEERIVFERFFDEVGDTHLVIHSPYGSRINRAWGLSLRKRMCRKFNFELQASALEDSIVLSLGPTHSFAMDVDGFVRLLQRIERGEIDVLARDLASPSPLSHAILNARPYAFLDDGAAEERRTKAVATKALMDLQTAHDIGRLDPQVIAQVREDAWPEIGSADELHDALCVHGFLAD